MFACPVSHVVPGMTVLLLSFLTTLTLHLVSSDNYFSFSQADGRALSQVPCPQGLTFCPNQPVIDFHKQWDAGATTSQMESHSGHDSVQAHLGLLLVKGKKTLRDLLCE